MMLELGLVSFSGRVDQQCGQFIARRDRSVVNPNAVDFRLDVGSGPAARVYQQQQQQRGARTSQQRGGSGRNDGSPQLVDGSARPGRRIVQWLRHGDRPERDNRVRIGDCSLPRRTRRTVHERTVHLQLHLAGRPG